MRFNSLYKHILKENSREKEYALLFDGDEVVRVGEEAQFDPFEDEGAPKETVTLSLLHKIQGKDWMRLLNGKMMQNVETYSIRFGSRIGRTFDISQTIQPANFWNEGKPTVTWFNVYWTANNIESFKLPFKVIDLEEYEKEFVNAAYKNHDLEDMITL